MILPGVRSGSAAWGDYDADGDLDILIAGNTGSDYVSAIYRNDADIFVDSGISLPGVADGVAQWGDYENDGLLDILLSGSTGATWISRVYHNDGPAAGWAFSDVNAGLVDVDQSIADWGDYDGDGAIDLILAGFSDDGPVSRST